MSKVREYLTDHPVVTILAVLGSIVTIFGFLGIPGIKSCNIKPKYLDTVEPIIIKPPIPIPIHTTQKISGFVYDSDGDPISNVKLTVTSIEDQIFTNQSGFFEFKIPTNLSKNEYRITFQKDGFKTKSETYFEIPKTDIVEYLQQSN